MVCVSNRDVRLTISAFQRRRRLSSRSTQFTSPTNRAVRPVLVRLETISSISSSAGTCVGSGHNGLQLIAFHS